MRSSGGKRRARESLAVYAVAALAVVGALELESTGKLNSEKDDHDLQELDQKSQYSRGGDIMLLRSNNQSLKGQSEPSSSHRIHDRKLVKKKKKKTNTSLRSTQNNEDQLTMKVASLQQSNGAHQMITKTTGQTTTT